MLLLDTAGTTDGLVARWVLPLLVTFPAVLIFRLTAGEESASSSLAKVGKSLGPYLMEAVGTFILASSVAIALVTGTVAVPVAAGLALTALVSETRLLWGS